MTTPFGSPVYTTGIKGPVVCRRELRELIKDADVLNLFVLAMDQMMKTPQDKLDSWFQIAAIHGR
jgi:tyrosinase